MICEEGVVKRCGLLHNMQADPPNYYALQNYT
jgi:hypothetical protein